MNHTFTNLDHQTSISYETYYNDTIEGRVVSLRVKLYLVGEKVSVVEFITINGDPPAEIVSIEVK